ncbi:unnamed protein product, partial [Mesorhabditis belari]|uniref:Uncharacterized protein n=1 Tax=Mesorhabditis belari TaxID=2138241 RepID=A0AAF3J2T0_9BILA
MSEGQENPSFEKDPNTSPTPIRRENENVVPESNGSESPRSIRSYHKGSNGTLTGGGMTKNYSKTVDIKQYKSKIDRRLGFCVLACLVIIATVLCVYGLIHEGVHSELTTYVNRTHQIAKELKAVMLDEYGNSENVTADDGKEWMTVEDLAHDAYMLSEVHSKVWWLFLGNLLIAILLTPILTFVHCGFVDGNGFKLVYRAVILACLIWFFAQFFYLLHPLLFGASRFPGMVDRLFITGYPRDEYQLNEIKSSFYCQWNPDPIYVKFRAARACMPIIKNSLFPAYTVILLIIFDVFPFVFAAFMYAWSACIKDQKHVSTMRTRVALNNQRRVNMPKGQDSYVPPDPKLIHLHSDDKHGRFV